MKRSPTSLPALPPGQFRGAGPGEAVWLRLSAFLSTRAPNTQETYLGVINEWCRFLGAEPGSSNGARLILHATDLNAIAYRNWLGDRPGEHPRHAKKSSASRVSTPSFFKAREKKTGLESTLSNATISKKFSALRRIYRMLISSNLGITTNPFDSDRVPPPPKESGRKRPTEMIPFELVRKIITTPDGKNPKGLRDRALLTVLFGGALRRSEAASLRVGDVRRSKSGTLFLYLRSTKAKRDAEQALPTWAAAAVDALVKQRCAEGAGAADFLFISYTGRGGTTATPDAVSDSGVYKLFKFYCQKAGAGEYVTPHSARATAITRLLSEGIPHRQVQEFSRHASIQMVELYDKRRMGVDENPGKLLDFD